MGKSGNNQTEPVSKNDISRRDFFKLGGVAGAAALVPAGVALAAGGKSSSKPRRLAMVIDLHRCTGCGGCIISCLNENNVQTGVTWGKKITKTVGKFPNVRLDFIPTLCNHCEKAPCVRAYPTGAMHKDDNDITAHDPEKCIGCKTCKAMCPYDVISVNAREPHRYWKGTDAAIKGCTSSGQQVVQKVKADTIPYYNKDKEVTYPGAALRYKGIVEKCTFCDHRVAEGKLPFCVESCPAEARIFGDLNDPNSEVRQLLGKYQPTRLKEHLGTEPKVFYIRSFNPTHYKATKGSL